MKPKFYTLVVPAIVLPLSVTLHAQTTTNNISRDWYNQGLKSIQQLEYEIKPVKTARFFSAATIARRTGFSISPDGYKVPFTGKNFQKKQLTLPDTVKGKT